MRTCKCWCCALASSRWDIREPTEPLGSNIRTLEAVAVATGVFLICRDRSLMHRRGHTLAKIVTFVFPFVLLGACVGIVYPGFALEIYFGDKLPFPGFVPGAIIGTMLGVLLAGITRLVINRKGRFGPIGTAVWSLVGLIVFMWAFSPISHRVIWFVFGGKLFTARPIVTGGALDQSSLHKGFFLFCLFSVITGLYLLVIRSIADLKQRRVRNVYRVLAVVCFLPAICMLTATSYDLLRYLSVMGYTPKRVQGVVFSLLSYAFVAGFIIWSSCEWRPWWLRSKRSGICPQCDYDLRGTPGYCPECGWRAAEQSNSTQADVNSSLQER